MTETQSALYTLTKPLLFVGLPGVGKSFLSKKLCEVTGLCYVDTDQELENRLGVSVSWIFEKEGEAGFRARETAILKEVLLKKPCSVIAGGGGVVTMEENRQLIADLAFVIYLKLDRARHKLQLEPGLRNRPLFKDKDVDEVLSSLEDTRAGWYEALCHLEWRQGDCIQGLLEKLALEGILRRSLLGADVA